jgi:hypothetical protein
MRDALGAHMTFPLLALGFATTGAIAIPLARWTRQHLAVSIAASAVLIYLQSVLFYGYTADDSYISYRYARNLADGHNLVWNPGEYVEGYSNFLWTVLLAGFARAGFDIPDTARALGFSCAVVAAVGTYLVVRALAPDVNEVAGLIACLLLAACGVWSVWATAGLEGPLFAALATFAVYLHLSEDEAPHTWQWSPALWALVAMTRPDGIALFAISGAFRIGRVGLPVMTGDASDGVTLSARAKVIAAYLAVFAAIYVPYFVWRYTTYGWLEPNTYYAKVGSGLTQYDRGFHYVATFLEQYAGWALLIVPAAVATDRARALGLAYVFTLVVAWLAILTYVGGDYLPGGRLIAPIVPLYIAVIVSSVAIITRRLHADHALPTWAASYSVTGFALAAMFLTLQSTVVSNGADTWIRNDRAETEAHVEIGKWLYANVQPGTTTAVIAAGATPYESRLPSIDMLGLSDEHIAHRALAIGGGTAGHEKYDSDYVLDRHPDIIILDYGLKSRPLAMRDYDAVLFGVTLAYRDMVKNARFRSTYEPRSVQIREGKWFNLFVRRDAEAVLAKTRPAP